MTNSTTSGIADVYCLVSTTILDLLDCSVESRVPPSFLFWMTKLTYKCQKEGNVLTLLHAPEAKVAYGIPRQWFHIDGLIPTLIAKLCHDPTGEEDISTSHVLRFQLRTDLDTWATTMQLHSTLQGYPSPLWLSWKTVYSHTLKYCTNYRFEY